MKLEIPNPFAGIGRSVGKALGDYRRSSNIRTHAGLMSEAVESAGRHNGFLGNEARELLGRYGLGGDAIISLARMNPKDRRMTLERVLSEQK